MPNPNAKPNAELCIAIQQKMNPLSLRVGLASAGARVKRGVRSGGTGWRRGTSTTCCCSTTARSGRASWGGATRGNGKICGGTASRGGSTSRGRGSGRSRCAGRSRRTGGVGVGATAGWVAARLARLARLSWLSRLSVLALLGRLAALVALVAVAAAVAGVGPGLLAAAVASLGVVARLDFNLFNLSVFDASHGDVLWGVVC